MTSADHGTNTARKVCIRLSVGWRYMQNFTEKSGVYILLSLEAVIFSLMVGITSYKRRQYPINTKRNVDSCTV